MRVRAWWWVLAAVMGAAPAAAGPVNEFAFNRVPVYTRALTQFVGASTTLTDEPTPINAIVDDPEIARTFTSESALLPYSGAPKDEAAGSISLTVLLQNGSGADLFSFAASGRASAVAALAAPDDPASAVVELIATAGFHLDSFGPATPAGMLLGTLHVDGLRAADDYETFKVEVSSLGHGVIDTLLPGMPALAVPLHSGDTYTLNLVYRMEVPFGVDPEFNLAFGASAAPVPEPMSYAFMLVGLGMLLSTRRKFDR